MCRIPLRWWIISLVTLGTILNYLARSTLSVAAPTLKTEFAMTTEQYSWVVLAFQASYTVMQTVAGSVLDAVGTRLGFFIFAIGWGLANMAHGLATGWQSLALFPFLNVRENVEFALKMRGVGKAERRKRAEQWLDRMQILEFSERNIAQLSGGQRQRVALARMLMQQAEVVAMDEPFSALDPATRRQMQDLARGVLRGRTVLMVTHDPTEALRMADRVLVLAGGTLAEVPLPGAPPRDPEAGGAAGALLRLVRAVS